MIRVHIACEGATEQTFVREVLQPYLPKLHIIAYLPGKLVSGRGIGRGGDIRYERVWKDFITTLKSDPSCYSTTFFDYYALGSDFLKLSKSLGTQPDEKAQRIELAVDQDIAEKMGKNFDQSRFKCYLSMHEFEALLFSNPARLADALDRTDLEKDLQSIRQKFPTPEDINDDPETAPSKRLIALCPRYDKVTGGNTAALEVGLDAMRSECPHFRSWLEWLESLG
jgi:hypothetical protein